MDAHVAALMRVARGWSVCCAPGPVDEWEDDLRTEDDWGDDMRTEDNREDDLEAN